MNKSELVAKVADDAGVSRADAEKVMGTFFDTVTAEAKRGNKVAWPGFGSFETTRRKARKGRNPQTGQSIKIGASTAMKFSAAQGLKDSLNPGGKKAAGKKRAAKKKGAAKKAGAKKKGGAKKKAGAKKRAPKRR